MPSTLELPPLAGGAGRRVGDLPALLPPTLRGPIALGAIEAEHRQATAAFVKFTGTDRLVETPRGGRGGARARSRTSCRPETADLGITWLESDIDRDGGKLYLVAGAPASAGDDEDRMLRALRADRRRRRRAARSRVGVNRGPVLAGPIGSPSRTTYAVMGDTVNLAARLAARAAKGEILATGDVLQRAPHEVRDDEPPVPDEGEGEAGDRPRGRCGDRRDGRGDAPASAARRPGAGARRCSRRRSTPCACVRAAPSRSSASRAPASRGSWRSSTASAVGFQILRARCEPYSSSTPFGPFRAMLRPLIGVLPDESRESAGAKLTAFAQTVMPDLAQWLPLLALPFDAEVADTAEVDEIDPVFRRDRLHDVLDQFLARMLLMPTVLLVEDVHWLDDASQLVLAKLAQPGPRPWLVVATRRPSGLPLAAAGGARARARAARAADEARALALAAAGDVALSEDQLAAVTERAAGNPLFIRELAVAPADDERLPETVESLLTIRIDTLERERPPAAPARLGDRADLRPRPARRDPAGRGDRSRAVGAARRLRRLGRARRCCASGTIWSGPPPTTVSRIARRREIHARVGDAIERRAAGRAGAADVLSLHFLEAGRYDKAWAYAVAAGDDARSKYANVDAATFYERALAAAGHFEPPSRGRRAGV